MADLGFPNDPAALDADWFTAALRSTRTIGEEVRVTRFEADQIGVGVGILALLWRVHLEYDPPDAGPGTAVLKLPQTMAESRHLANAFRFYEREVRFYEQAAERTPLRTAARYASAYDERTKDFVLLMEDLGGRVVHDQLIGCPPEDAERDLRCLAAHHAAWWGSPELPGLPWAVRVIDPPNPQALVPELRQSWPFIEANFGHLLRGPMLAAAKRMPEAVVPLMERLSAPPVTLLHGDHRLDNLFFSDDEGTEGVGVVDWQITGTGRGAYDVGYFLSQSLVPEERKGVEHDLVASYHRTLVERGVQGYSFDDCWEDYRLATLFVSVYPLSAGSLDLVNDRAVELFTAMLDRSVSAILDLDALELMPA
jgi:Phosphotransferase enzyme family